MERLWSTWRLAYVTGAARATTCVFCDEGESRDALTLIRGRYSYVVLNLYPYNSGHVMVVPDRHIGSLAAATEEELSEMMAFVRDAEVALTEAYDPQGINVGINLGRPAGAGIIDHVHVHLVPRWTGDTSFISVVGNVRVLPEALEASAARLRPVFERLIRERGAPQGRT
jgi:ATP adenylyltransferase